jgi:ABC-type tungstate transport system substrate-binding protein
MPEQASALALVLTADPDLYAIVRLSLAVSLGATVLAALLGAPLGALIALSRFPGRQVVVVIMNALMGLPPVVVGLTVYLLLSRSGPLGEFGLLFTPAAMVMTQTVLVLPIIAALTRQTVGVSIATSSRQCGWDDCIESVRCCGMRGFRWLLRCSRDSAAPRQRWGRLSSSAATSRASRAR